MLKTCSKCQKPKSESEFRKDSRYLGGLFCWCRACVHSYGSSPKRLAQERIRRKRRFSDPRVREARRIRCRARYALPEVKRRHKAERYLRQYGITLEFFEAEVARLKSVCCLCQQVRELVADHNHTSLRYRGAICKICNAAVSRIENYPGFVKRAEAYLR